MSSSSADTNVLTSLSSIECSTVSQADKVNQFSNLLTRITTESLPDKLVPNMLAFVDSVLAESVGIVASRPILGVFVNAVEALPDLQARKAICVYTIEKLRPRIVSFEEQDSKMREILATVYETEDDNAEAAKALQGITLESSQRLIDDQYRLDIYIRIMRNLLEDDDTTAADSYLNRATYLIYKCTNPESTLLFQLCQARVLDAKRQFLNACQRYHQLSFSPLIAETERMHCLSAAITCAVLAPAGPQRSRSLATLYKDDRSPQLPADYSMLEKMYLDRLLSPQEVTDFSERLKPHQLAKLSDGSTVLAKAVIEHNLLATSKLYNNIGVEELGILLGLSGAKAEEYAARMIEQKRLAGRIDQIDKLIYFDVGGLAAPVTQDAASEKDRGGKEGKNTGGQADAVIGKELRKWDERIAGVAQEVENITSMLQNEYPDFVAKNLLAA
ncbi:PCI domain-containing protein [Tirmania nivea]|nr:PCI domain-containing protein [Tirmania nivea]